MHWIQGNVLDLGSGGSPVVPWAIQVELPHEEFNNYTAGSKPEVEPQWRGSAFDLPFKDGTVDTVFSSHLLEDFNDWTPILSEWTRVLKVGGHIVILIPDKTRWNEALKRGQPPNCAHMHEGNVGELSTYAQKLGITVIVDGLTNLSPDDYSILFVAKKNI